MEDKKGLNGTRLVTTIIFVVATAVIFLALGYWAGSQSVSKTSSKASATATVTATTSAKTSGTATANVTANWKTYTDSNYSFSIKYPTRLSGDTEDWIYKVIPVGGTLETISFGPPSSAQGGYVWGITIANNTTLDGAIEAQGKQWSDRVESKKDVKVGGYDAILATVTTPSHPEWISKVVYLDKNGTIYKISNGAVDNSAFESFYSSFQFTK